MEINEKDNNDGRFIMERTIKFELSKEDKERQKRKIEYEEKYDQKHN